MDESNDGADKKRKPSSPDDNKPLSKISKLSDDILKTDNSKVAKKRPINDDESETKNEENLQPPSKMRKPDRGERDSGAEGLRRHSKKDVRHRTKNIRNQLEFYFSDSNLSKDRFFKDVTGETGQGYVSLSVFEKFNKLQELIPGGVPKDVLQSAIKHSKILQLSDDKQSVSRISPFCPISKEEQDSRTIYVENLPAKVNHDWIRQVFSKAGRVAYVSLPKYKTTRDIKGFAFIEFTTAEEAAKACQLNNPPSSHETEKLGKFPKWNKTLTRFQKAFPDRTDITDYKTTVENTVDVPKKIDENVDEVEKGENVNEALKKKKKRKKKKKTVESASDNKSGAKGQDDSVDEKGNISTEEGNEVKKKKKRKRKKRTSVSENESQAEDNILYYSDKAASAGEESFKDQDATNKTLDLSSENSPRQDKSLEELSRNEESKSESEAYSPKKKKRKRRKRTESRSDTEDSKPPKFALTEKENRVECLSSDLPITEGLSRKERKKLRQEDIRKKKKERDTKGKEKNCEPSKDTLSDPQTNETEQIVTESDAKGIPGAASLKVESKTCDSIKEEEEDQVTSILGKVKRLSGVKRVEFDPVPVTQEYKVKTGRRRRKAKEKVQLRVISKREWDGLRAEYIRRQKSHMAALKESLRELKQLDAKAQAAPASRHVDLEDVFGTKRLKPTQEVKMAHVEALQFTPNVIVQWKVAHAMPRSKIRSLVNALGSNLGANIAYIDSEEEAKSGYIRFKDEKSAETFTKGSRNSDFISARMVPEDQQKAYWEKANEDRMKRLGRNKKEKGSERIARKVFNKNKETFTKKPNRIIFSDDSEKDKTNQIGQENVERKENVVKKEDTHAIKS